MAQHQLSLENLSCERDERLLFSGLHAEFSGGDIVHVAGPNGAGKTTLLRVITGLSSDFTGQVKWCGQIAKGYEFFSSLLYHGHLAGVNPSLTPLENLDWYFGLNGSKAENHRQLSQSQYEQALAHVGLSGYGDIPCFQMSAGQQRRVALARLYISEAPLWVLDEPFTAIDRVGVEQLEQRITAHAAQGGMVLLTTHQTSSLKGIKVLDVSTFRGRAE